MLTDLFGPDPAANQRLWVRSARNPVIRPEGTGWAEDFIAACTVVETEGRLRLYAEGSAGGHEQIGLFTATAGPGDLEWSRHPDNPILRVGDGFDRGGVFDPAVVRFRDRWLLYYSATEGDAHAFAETLDGAGASEVPRDEAIGLAESADGIAFVKHPASPVLAARCPFAVVHDGTVYLYFVRVAAGGYRVHLATSDDGFTFVEHAEGPVLDVGGAGEWDSHSVTTPKVFWDQDRWCMAYAGDAERLDDPTGIGLAQSDDLLTWEKFPGNPVFVTGDSGSFDSVSVASPIIRRDEDGYSMLYAGSDRAVRDGLHSQVGAARVSEAQ